EKTQDDIYAKAKAINDMVANPKHIVTPTPDPEPTPTPDPGYEPYEPSWPDEPYRPERPYRPYRPSVDKTEEKKEEPSPVIPKEEKKDYGIVDTEELLPVTLNDIPNTAAGTAIRSLVSRGILAGMGNDKFQGELPITRAMVSAVLMRISVDKSINTQTKFTDVKAGDWFNEAVMWAAGNGLFVGYPDGSFKPNKLVSRQELALILQKFLALHGIKMDEVKTWTYNDLDKVPAWSKDAVVAMAKIALVNGQTDTMYNPESEFTREELAEMLYNKIRWVETH
ncbi:MAG: S-layer homology domain-containing protein, partial [Fenollaria timonensis]